MNERQQIAEQAAALLFRIATSEDSTISFYQSPLYVRARTMLHAAIAEAYGAQLAQVSRTVADVIEVWVDCNESINYCVGYVIEAANAEAQAQREARAEDFLETAAGRSFTHHTSCIGGFGSPVAGLSPAHLDALEQEAIKVLSGAQRCACGSDHILLRKDHKLF